jgi:uncharacterized membrane protein YphA (DoxX/SURF4 family)
MIENGRSGKGMAQALTEGRRSASGSTGKIMNVVLWVLQVAAAGMFLMVGFLKLSGNAQLVGLFEAIGLGQSFRYLTGALEVAGAFLLLIPRTSGLGALMLAGVMVVAWGRRQRTMNLLAKQQ